MYSRQLSDSFATAVERAAQGVVRVDARRRVGSSGLRWGVDLVVVAAHTLERDNDIVVTLADGTASAARLLGSDAATDLAVLRLPNPLPEPAWQTVEPPAVGHLVLAVGRPGRLRASVSIVTSRHESGRGGADTWIETDLGPWPGFSGSAAIDADGALIGMNSAAYARRSMVVPVATLARVVQELVATGRVAKPWLGIGTHPVHLGTALAERAGQDRALLVDAVAPGSPAEKGGVLLGDALVRFEGKGVAGVEELLARLTRDQVGHEVHLGLLRAGQLVDVVVTVGSR